MRLCSFIVNCHHLISAFKRRLYRLWVRIQIHSSNGRIHVNGNICCDAPVSFEGTQGCIEIGSDVKLGWRLSPLSGILIQARSKEATIAIGNKCHINNNVSITANKEIVIGDSCLCGAGVSITDCDWHEIDPRFRSRSSGISKAVRIGNNVWLGSRVQVLKGVEIGDGAIIGAGAVVVSDVAPYTIAAGVPAHFVKEIRYE
jgi:acetyltransferase-like isoleucine patch superfamily enzyme